MALNAYGSKCLKGENGSGCLWKKVVVLNTYGGMDLRPKLKVGGFECLWEGGFERLKL